MSLRFDTYSKFIISDNKCLSEIIRQHSQPVKPEDQAETHGIQLLENQDLLLAMNSPYKHFIQMALRSYGKLYSASFKNIATDSDSIINKGVQKDLAEQIEALPTFKQTTNDAYTKLDQLVNTQHQSWLQFSKDYQQQLSDTLSNSNIKPTNEELAMLSDNEPLPKLLARLTDLQINTQPTRGVQTISFHHYYTLKLRELINNALARQQVSSLELPKQLESELGQFDKIQSKLDKAEAALLQEHQSEGDDLLASYF